MSNWPEGFSPALRAALTSVTGAFFFLAPDRVLHPSAPVAGAWRIVGAARARGGVPGAPADRRNCWRSSLLIGVCAP